MTKPLAVLDRSVLADLDSILIAEGAHLWSKQAVAAHKRTELANAPVPSRLWAYRGTINTWILNAKSFCAMVTSLGYFLAGGAVIGVVLLWKEYMSADNLPYLVWAGIMGIAAVIIGCSLETGFNAIGRIQISGPAQWQTHLLHNFETAYGKIPHQARELLDRLSVFGTQSVWVDALIQDKVLLDPVLVVNMVDPKTGIVVERNVMVWDKDGNIIPPPV